MKYTCFIGFKWANEGHGDCDNRLIFHDNICLTLVHLSSFNGGSDKNCHKSWLLEWYTCARTYLNHLFSQVVRIFLVAECTWCHTFCLISLYLTHFRFHYPRLHHCFKSCLRKNGCSSRWRYKHGTWVIMLIDYDTPIIFLNLCGLEKDFLAFNCL